MKQSLTGYFSLLLITIPIQEIEGEDYQILVEADFLVNLFEDGSGRETAEKVRENIFKTKTGMKYLETLFLTERRS